MNAKIVRFVLFIYTFASLCQLEAYHPYRAEIALIGDSAKVSDPNLLDLSRSLKTAAIEQILPSYTPTSAVAIGINLRGILALTAFAANSTTLNVVLPQSGVVESFAGATRDESIELFRQYVRDGGTHHHLLRAYARYSPIDPIAGNPNSLMAQMGQSDYMMGHLSPLSGCDCHCWSAQPVVHQFQTGLNTLRAFSHKFDTTTVSMPLRYSYSPNGDWAFVVDAPVTFIANGGAYSVYSSLGFGLRIPLTCDWSLTPCLRAGAGGSLDLCTAGDFVSVGLTSVFNLPVCDYVLSITNYAGYINSGNLWLSGVNFNYNLHNYIFKNGLSLTSCDGFCVCGHPVNFSLSFIDSCFTKDRLYIRHYDEVGIYLITNYLNPCIDYDCLSVGFAYQFGEKSYKGYSLNMIYQF